MEWIDLAQDGGPVMGFYERDNELSGLIQFFVNSRVTQ
jgi:hypothetical protein